MNIDLSLLHSRVVDKIEITGLYDIPSDYYKNYDEIIKLEKISVNGIINQDADENDFAICSIEGVMILKDSISLDPVEYPFSIEYNDILEESCKKNENTLDIFSFLWENIVLEVPLQFTKVTDLSKFHGNGWKLVSEEEQKNSHNPFSDLLKEFK